MKDFSDRPKKKNLIALMILPLLVAGLLYLILNWLKLSNDVALFAAGVSGFEAWLVMLLTFRQHRSLRDKVQLIQLGEIRPQKKMFWSLLLLFSFLCCFLFGGKIIGFWLKLPLVALSLWMAYRFLSALLSLSLSGWEADAQRRSKRVQVFLSAGFFFALTIIFIAVNLLGTMLWWESHFVTSKNEALVKERVKRLKSNKQFQIYDGNNRYLGVYRREESDWLSAYEQEDLMDSLPAKIFQIAEGGVVTADFWWNYLPGGEKLKTEPFSFKMLLKVPYHLLTEMRMVGGSTPALQLGKNLLNYGRKQRMSKADLIRTKLFEEMPLAYTIAQMHSPKEVMAYYFATIWSGYSNHYGLARMSLFFFGEEDPFRLNAYQVVILASALPNAGVYNPRFLEGCLEGKLKSTKPQKVKYCEAWRERVAQIRGRVIQGGMKVEEKVSVFINGLGRVHGARTAYAQHDGHLRSWIRQSMDEALFDSLEHNSRIQMYYDRELMIGKGKNDGIIGLLRKQEIAFRGPTNHLQFSLALIDGKKKSVIGLYGGDKAFDMALASKPVVGSTMKALVYYAVTKYWPSELPLMNHGRIYRAGCVENPTPCIRRRHYFVYHPTRRIRGHSIKNSHAMPHYLSKQESMIRSANIAMVFLSLRWTWLLHPKEWKKVLRDGLIHFFVEKKNLDRQDAVEKINRMFSNPKYFKKVLAYHFGRSYTRNFSSATTFEAAKAATVKSLLSDTAVDKKWLTNLLALHSDRSLEFFPEIIQEKYRHWKAHYQNKFKTLSIEQLGWVRDLRMHMGLRNIIRVSQAIAGKDFRLKPVLTMTLGVNDASTLQLAKIASFFSIGKPQKASILKAVSLADGEVLFRSKKTKVKAIRVGLQSLEETREVMKGVLSSTEGTAKSVKALIEQDKHGLSDRYGGKTGTVQGMRGVSCIGYLGDLAGAVTISLPNNERIRLYRLRASFTRQYNALTRRRQRRLRRLRISFANALKRFQGAKRKGSRRVWKARSYRLQGRVRRVERQLEVLRVTQDKNMLKYRKHAATYYKLRTEYVQLRKINRRLLRKLRRSRRRVSRIKRKQTSLIRRIHLIEARIERSKKSLARLEEREDRWAKRRKLQLSRRLVSLSKHLKEAKSQKKKVDLIFPSFKHRLKDLIEVYRKALVLFIAKSNAKTRAYRIFRRSYSRRAFSSKNACEVLFKALLQTRTVLKERVKEASKSTVSPAD